MKERMGLVLGCLLPLITACGSAGEEPPATGETSTISVSHPARGTLGADTVPTKPTYACGPDTLPSRQGDLICCALPGLNNPGTYRCGADTSPTRIGSLACCPESTPIRFEPKTLR